MTVDAIPSRYVNVNARLLAPQRGAVPLDGQSIHKQRTMEGREEGRAVPQDPVVSDGLVVEAPVARGHDSGGWQLAGPVGAPTPTANALPTLVAGGTVNTENTSPWLNVSGSTGIINASTNYKLVSKGITSPQGIFQSGTLRGPGAPQTGFANEQLMDMLAIEANMDPIAFRIQNILPDAQNQRWVGVLQAVAAA